MARAAGWCQNRPWLSLLTIFFVATVIGKGVANDWSSKQARGSFIGTGGLKLPQSDDLPKISLSSMPQILPKRRYSYSISMFLHPCSLHNEISQDIQGWIMLRMAQMGNLLRFQLSFVLFRGTSNLTSDEPFHSLAPAIRIQTRDSIWMHKQKSADAVE